MKNKWLANRLFWQLSLGWYLVLIQCTGDGMAQSKRYDAGLSLPQVIYNIDIELDNVFLTSSSKRGTDQHDQGRFGATALESMQLVGVLILGEKKFAWIKTHDNALFELESGQQVPGSRFRVEHIFADSVALVNDEICQRSRICDAMFFLDLNR